MRLDEQVRQIIALNHAWKRQREIHPPNDPIPMMLQARKASMQVELLRLTELADAVPADEHQFDRISARSDQRPRRRA